MRTIHLVSHTHWDREWYLTFQQFRLRLVHLVDGLLELLAADPGYQHFMLDGQTIVLDDYLRMRPEAEPILRQFIESGRVLIGPWHVLPDMFLVGPEAHIRNLLEGDRQVRRFGNKMLIGYMPDSFGHIGQMPQILAGFGIDNACLWRGLDDQPTEFWWQSPDGSRVLMLYLRDSYSNGAALNAGNPDQFVDQIRQAADSLASHSAVQDLLVMYGTDHMEPPIGTSKAIKVADEHLKQYRVRHSTLPSYLGSVQAQLAAGRSQIPTVTGELRSSKRSHLLPGVLSTRIWIKQRNHACETLLENWAEPFSTFASFVAVDDGTQGMLKHPLSILHEAWNLLMECHPHDSICGCSIDQVHDEMKARFDQVEQIGEEITRQSLVALASAVNTSGPARMADVRSTIVVFNSSSTERTDAVTCDVVLPPDVAGFEIVDESGNVIPHQSAEGHSTDLINVQVRREELGGMLAMVHEGRVGNMAIQDIRFRRADAVLHLEAIFAEDAEPDVKVWEEALSTLQEELKDASISSFHIHARSPESARITFVASGVPGLGWRTFYVRARDNLSAEVKVTPIMAMLAPLAKLPWARRFVARLAQPRDRPPYILENDSLSVELDVGDATIVVKDRASGRTYRGLNRFVDGGDCGDTYNFCPPPTDILRDRVSLRRVTIIHGPVQQRMTVSLLLAVPASLSSDRRSRSKEMVDVPITTTITLTQGVPRVDIHTSVENRARDHRLRVHFPAPFTVRSVQYDGHFEIVERPVGIPSFDSAWIEEPRPEAPQRAFTSIKDGESALTIANRGLPEAEVLQGPAGSVIALTLLRCVGWLSRDDFSTRHGHAGPFLETPKAQMPGRWEFDYSIITADAPDSSYQRAWNFQTPLRAAVADLHPGQLPSSGFFVSADHPAFRVTAVKMTEDGRGWIVRGYNTADKEIHLRLEPWRRFARAEHANLSEHPIRQLEIRENGEVTAQLRGHEIVTVMFAA